MTTADVVENHTYSDGKNSALDFKKLITHKIIYKSKQNKHIKLKPSNVRLDYIFFFST
jgi:hypothetical protein